MGEPVIVRTPDAAADEERAFDMWFDGEYPVEYGGHRPKFQMTGVMDLMLAAWQARAAQPTPPLSSDAWPIPLTTARSPVFAHTLEVIFKDDEDADLFGRLLDRKIAMQCVKYMKVAK
jgi:hypothetical protein